MKISENAEVKKLWALSARDFNEWRRSNDLPLLLQFFKTALPHFSEWQKWFRIDDTTFLSSDRPSMFFRGTSDLFLRRTTGPDRNGSIETSTSFGDLPPEEAERQQQRHWGKVLWKIESAIKFTPFFRWLTETKQSVGSPSSTPETMS